MKNRILLLFLFIAICLIKVRAQQNYALSINNKTVELPENKGKLCLSRAETKRQTLLDVLHLYVQFYQLPGDNEKKELEAKGLRFLAYIPNNTYICSVNKKNLKSIPTKGIRSISLIDPENKINPLLNKTELPIWALKPNNKIDLLVSYYNDFKLDDIRAALLKNKFYIISENDAMHHFQIRVKTDEIKKVASLPFVSYVDPERAPAIPENEIERTDHRSFAIDNNLIGANGLHYDGTGVNVALGDDGVIGPHIDYTGRTDQTWVGSTNNGNHGDHVAGILAGAGNLNPVTKGTAPGCSLYVYMPYENINNLPNHYSLYKIRITSLSYGQICNEGYSTDANRIDEMMLNFPAAMSVFSSGNSGTFNCNYKSANIAGWGNITGGMKSGKNVIAVGNVWFNDSLEPSSSRGPATDGRIKPDISAVGTNVNSTVNPNTYMTNTGTSMSCPAISGVLAQLYQAFRANNNGMDPAGALMKGILLNSADDIGNPGPDYKFGYGRVNALNALRLIENKSYMESFVSNNDSVITNLTIPPNVKKVKIMMYYADIEATSGVDKALVNDLNMSVKDAQGLEYDPWVLNPAANSITLNAPAIRKIDSLNNMEQVTIDNPVTGTATIKVKGFQVPFGPQKFYIIYEFIYDSLQLVYPLGNDHWTPGITETMRWDSWNTTDPITIQTSTDNVSWSTVASNLSGKSRLFTYTVPSVTGGKLWVKLKQGTNESVTKQFVNVTNIPSNLKLDWICSGSCRISWNAVANATSYNVYKLGAKYMDSVANTTNTYYVFSGIDSTKEDWFSVKTLINNNQVQGERANAIQKNKLIKLNCSSTITANFTNSRNNICANDTISFNPTTNPTTGLAYFWTFNGGTPATSTLMKPIVQYNQPGTYAVSLAVSNASGGITVNKNSLITILGTTVNAGSDQFICEGDSVTLTGFGGVSLIWSYNKAIVANTASTKVGPTQTSTYVLTSVSSGGCTSYDSMVVFVNPLPAKPVIAKNSLTLATTASATNYLWYKDGQPISSANQFAYTPQTHGAFKVRVGNGYCYAFSDEEFFIPAGVKSSFATKYISLYPNPNPGSFAISGVNENATISIYDIIGKDVTSLFARRYVSNKVSFTNESISPGVYFVNVRSEDTYKTLKFVVE